VNGIGTTETETSNTNNISCHKKPSMFLLPVVAKPCP